MGEQPAASTEPAAPGIAGDQQAALAAESGSPPPSAEHPGMAGELRGILGELGEAVAAEGQGPAPKSPVKPGQQTGQTEAVQAEAGETSPLDQIEALASQLPPEAAAALSAQVGQLRTWTQQVEQYANQCQHYAEEQASQVDRVLTLARHPKFQAALKAVTEGAAAAAGHAGGNGTGQVEAGQIDQAIAAAETEGERLALTLCKQLVNQNQALHQELEQAFGSIGQRFQANDEMTFQQRASTAQSELAEAHKALDPQYPDLVADDAARRSWAAKAVTILRISQEEGHPCTLHEALEQAAQLLTVKKAEQRGAKNALQAATRAAKTAGLRPDHGRALPSSGELTYQQAGEEARRRLSGG